MTDYVSFRTISNLQFEIMKFVDFWVKTENTPVPRKEIVKAMEAIGKTKYAVKNALFGLMRQGYLRSAIMGVDVPLNERFYVKLRGV